MGDGEGGEGERLWEILKTVLFPVEFSRESLTVEPEFDVVASFTTRAKITVMSPRTPPKCASKRDVLVHATLKS